MSEAKKVLVVEDSPAMRQLIRFALSKLKDLEVVEANDGVDGLSKLSGQKFQLLVVDINMPIMDGLKLIDMVRKNIEHKDVPILIITTESAEEDRQRAMALGVDEYLTKPVQSQQIVESAKKLMGI
jgi:two-component system chemotaxis response regulator CheY